MGCAFAVFFGDDAAGHCHAAFSAVLRPEAREQEHGKLAYAAHALTYVDTKEAVDLIADVNKWTYQFDNNRSRPGRFDKGRTIYGDSIQALQNMYYTTNKPEIERHIIKKMGGVAPHLLRKPDKRQKKPNIPST